MLHSEIKEELEKEKAEKRISRSTSPSLSLKPSRPRAAFLPSWSALHRSIFFLKSAMSENLSTNLFECLLCGKFRK